MTTFFTEERFPENWYRRESPLEFADVQRAVAAIRGPVYPAFAGAKNEEGVYVRDSLDNNPYFGTVRIAH